MCQKCVPSIKLAKLPLGKIKFYAHYLDTHTHGSVPLFADKHSNLAIEGYLYLIRKAKTNRKNK